MSGLLMIEVSATCVAAELQRDRAPEVLRRHHRDLRGRADRARAPRPGRLCRRLGRRLGRATRGHAASQPIATTPPTSALHAPAHGKAPSSMMKTVFIAAREEHMKIVSDRQGVGRRTPAALPSAHRPFRPLRPRHAISGPARHRFRPRGTAHLLQPDTAVDPATTHRPAPARHRVCTGTGMRERCQEPLVHRCRFRREPVDHLALGGSTITRLLPRADSGPQPGLDGSNLARGLLAGPHISRSDRFGLQYGGEVLHLLSGGAAQFISDFGGPAVQDGQGPLGHRGVGLVAVGVQDAGRLVQVLQDVVMSCGRRGAGSVS